MSHASGRHSEAHDFLEVARNRLADALNRADSEQVPLQWAAHHRTLSERRSWPDIPVFVATALLARSASSSVNPRSLAPDAPIPGAYDARQLSREVLMPALADLRRPLGASHRCPLDERPWSLASMVDEHFPAPNRSALEPLLSVLQEVAALNEQDAQTAVVAFLRAAESKRRRY